MQNRTKSPEQLAAARRLLDEPKPARLPTWEESQDLLIQVMNSNPLEICEPTAIPFDHLPEEMQEELLALPQELLDPVEIKLCDRCGQFAILFHELVVWTGAGPGLGVRATVTHKACMGKPIYGTDW